MRVKEKHFNFFPNVNLSFIPYNWLFCDWAIWRKRVSLVVSQTETPQFSAMNWNFRINLVESNCRLWVFFQQGERGMVLALPHYSKNCENIREIFLLLLLLLSCFSHPTLCDLIDGSPRGSRPWDSPGKNTGVGCHFLLLHIFKTRLKEKREMRKKTNICWVSESASHYTKCFIHVKFFNNLD